MTSGCYNLPRYIYIYIYLYLFIFIYIYIYLYLYIYIYVYWLVVYLPLWKMMEFLSWDDDIPNILGKSEVAMFQSPATKHGCYFGATLMTSETRRSEIFVLNTCWYVWSRSGSENLEINEDFPVNSQKHIENLQDKSGNHHQPSPTYYGFAKAEWQLFSRFLDHGIPWIKTDYFGPCELWKNIPIPFCCFANRSLVSLWLEESPINHLLWQYD